MSLFDKPSVLMVISGMSPAVISETAWAIYQEYPGIHIREVIVITTSQGKDMIVSQLLPVWEKLKQELKVPEDELKFGNSSNNIRLLSSQDCTYDLSDVKTTEDNLAMADAMLGYLRSYADNPDNNLLVCLAGGRKTMSSMMGFCFSLVAREDDKLFHVLVNSPFDKPKLNPIFLFPTSEVTEYTFENSTIPASDAHISLIDIPFVQLRKLFPQQFGKAPGTYTELTQFANKAVEDQSNLELKFDLFDAKCYIGGNDLKLSPKQWIIYYTFACLTKAGKPVVSTKDLQEPIKKKLKEFNNELKQRVHKKLQKSYEMDDSNIRKELSAIKDKIIEIGAKFQNYIPARRDSYYTIKINPDLIILDYSESYNLF